VCVCVCVVWCVCVCVCVEVVHGESESEGGVCTPVDGDVAVLVVELSCGLYRCPRVDGAEIKHAVEHRTVVMGEGAVGVGG
jgi:hypothetical protein